MEIYPRVTKGKIASLAVFFVLGMLGCSAGPLISDLVSESPTPLGTQAANTPLPLASPSVIAAGQPGAPGWWPADLAMPKTAVLTSSSRSQAIWNTNDLNVDGIREFLFGEAQAANYTSYSIPLSQGSIYDLLFVKGGSTFAVNLTQGSQATVITGTVFGTMHVQVSGSVNWESDLPLRERFNLAAGSEIALGTSIPNMPQCPLCQYLVYVHIAPFKGPGIYRSKPAGIYVIDAQVVPGGEEGMEDYRWAQECTVVVKDTQSGNLACAGLQNVNDSSKRINLIASWQQPP